MRITSKMVFYLSLTDQERYKNTDVRYSANGVPHWTMSENKIMTPRIAKLLNDKNNPLIPELKFMKGTLNVQNGCSYRVPTRYHGMQAYSFSRKGYSYWKPAYDMPEQDFRHFSNQEEYEDIYMTNSFLRAFEADNLDTFISRVSWYNPRTSAARELLRLGAPKGKLIKISKYDEEFMIDYDNGIYTYEDINNLRDSYNRRDCKEYNHPPGTIYRIEEKDYIVDDNWRLTIPEGVICTPARVEIIRPSS